MTPAKRLMDIVLALALSLVLLPIFLGLMLAILVLDGRPIFYASQRALSPTANFRLWKFRTMTTDVADAGVSGGDKNHRITRVGHMLRRLRLDEIPQLWNILKGDISFVGPRPPLPGYVTQFPEIYGRVLESRPGVTGLATLVYHRTEERLLAQCNSALETEKVYTSICIPRKAKLDLIYAKNRNVCSDLSLIIATGLGRKLLRHRSRR